MNEATVSSPKEQENTERYKNLIVILTVLTTVLAAVIAALQADASIRSDIANRDSQYYAVQVSGELQRAGLEASYEFNVFGNYLQNIQENTVLGLTALQQEQNGDEQAAQNSNELAEIAQARADVGEAFSIFYTDPRYKPKSEGELPKAEQYILDSNKKATDLLAMQNEAADDYQKWNRKSDSYVTALTILAVAFFLFGLAQAVKSVRARLAFTSFGLVVILFSLFLTAITLLG